MTVSKTRLALSATALLLLSGPVRTGHALPAFPGAEGFGSETPGGRGGEVLVVATLEDYNPKNEEPIPGSLRLACSEKGPRIIVFRVSGTIRLKQEVKITEPYITIAGQSAPGGGICLRDYPVKVQTHDVIIRHLRFRLGDFTKKDSDSLSLKGARDTIIDHCSAGWSIDETLSVTGHSDSVTVQWCLISESLNDSCHPKGRHGYGSLIYPATHGAMTFHHNIYAHHASRNPRPGGSSEYPGPLLDFRNNLIYNWGFRAGYNGEDWIRINYINNYLKPGPSTTDPLFAFTIGGASTAMYLSGNHMLGNATANENNWAMVRHIPENIAERKFLSAPVQTETAREAYESLLGSCGAMLPARDSVDARVIETIRDGTGSIINSQDEVGGWPALAQLPPPSDTDLDGMPDEWEGKHGLNPRDPSDAAGDQDEDGYTNIEEFLNGIVNP